MRISGSAGEIQLALLSEGEQTGDEVATWLCQFIGAAQRSLDIAIYDFRLGEAQAARVTQALGERAQAGVAIRIAYDAGKPEQPNLEGGIDPAPAGTGAFVEALGYPARAISGMKLMHSKYIVRDAGQPGAAVWTGSTNFTDDAWTLEENTIVQLPSAQLAAAYTHDFNDLWAVGDIGDSGDFDGLPASLPYQGAPAQVQVFFSPGRGPAIDYEVAHYVAQAQRRVRVCSMLLNSGALIAALSDLLRIGRVPVDGIYDSTQMAEVFQQWQSVPHNHWKIGAIQEIVQRAPLVGKRSTPYSPTSRHDFMHDKTLVVDDLVITGSYNFSHSAEQNAENILLIQSAALADTYSAFIDHLIAKYQATGTAGAGT
ncbi:MAG TPA: phosphatidylserine/phosphatidylglycerophosphate/cardiolipin synthase family protein [Ktedonobacterales bacterium]|nr:phosphatidylserine/phosphatidylglycerophosphate/cardiolipin synthase family protein [Ktedonobacterales bacterium]